MLHDNIRSLRKEKGYTQEELAARINVVRQTVSKWEKGFSVPDSEALQKLADVLEVDIKKLLGAPVVGERKNDEVVEQLARINEQLVIKNRRAHRIWKTIGIILAVTVGFYILLMILGAVLFSVNFSSSETMEMKVDKPVVEIEAESEKVYPEK